MVLARLNEENFPRRNCAIANTYTIAPTFDSCRKHQLRKVNVWAS